MTTEREQIVAKLVMSPMSDYLGTEMTPVERTADDLVAWLTARDRTRDAEVAVKALEDAAAIFTPAVAKILHQRAREIRQEAGLS